MSRTWFETKLKYQYSSLVEGYQLLSSSAFSWGFYEVILHGKWGARLYVRDASHSKLTKLLLDWNMQSLLFILIERKQPYNIFKRRLTTPRKMFLYCYVLLNRWKRELEKCGKSPCIPSAAVTSSTILIGRTSVDDVNDDHVFSALLAFQKDLHFAFNILESACTYCKWYKL